MQLSEQDLRSQFNLCCCCVSSKSPYRRRNTNWNTYYITDESWFNFEPSKNISPSYATQRSAITPAKSDLQRQTEIEGNFPRIKRPQSEANANFNLVLTFRMNADVFLFLHVPSRRDVCHLRVFMCTLQRCVLYCTCTVHCNTF